MNLYSLLSDLILVIHFAFIGFILAGFIAIWIGYFRSWAFVRSFRFRLAHLLAMGFVLFESVVGMVCPLTEWENQLRQRAGDGSRHGETFVQYWLGRVLFLDLSEQTFIAIYAAFFVLLALTLWIVPPRWSRCAPRQDQA